MGKKEQIFPASALVRHINNPTEELGDAGSQGGSRRAGELHGPTPLSSLHTCTMSFTCVGLNQLLILDHFTSSSPSSRRHRIKSHKTGIFKKPPFKTQLQRQVFCSKSPTLKKHTEKLRYVRSGCGTNPNPKPAW